MKRSNDRIVFLGLAALLAMPVAACSRRPNQSTEISSPDATEPSPSSRPTSAATPNSGPSSVSSGDSSPKYVGTSVCVKCHPKRHQSYLKSHHSRSLAKVDVDAEVVDRTVDHPLSHRSYEIISRDDKLWHSETLLESKQTKSSGETVSAGASDPLVLADYAIDYVIGSGKFAKGYLISEGQYLLQSPITWYAQGQTYGMSPGYDSPSNSGFGRVVTDQCLFCHSGSVSRIGDNPNHFKIHELSIGCERCHGPGEHHVEHFEAKGNGVASDELEPFRDSIIHPGKLNRLQSESLCGQCHCQGEAPVSVAGKQDWDFRPGDDFASVKINYDAIVTDRSSSRFVGHFPQLHESKCYQGSTTLTCITCHDPHHHPAGEQRDELHRQQCLSCHQQQACGVALDTRIKSARNRCVDCHMPKTQSEVPHTSTTNHRIAVHSLPKAEEAGGAGEPSLRLAPQVLALQNAPAEMTAGQVARMRALGMYWLYRKHVGDVRLREFGPLSGQALEAVVQESHGDAEVFASLAMLTFMQIQSVPNTTENRVVVSNMWEYAMARAQEALRLESKPTESRATALEIAGRYFYRAGKHQPSVAVFRELTRLRRRKYDWATLGISLAEIGNLRESEAALRESIRINGGDPDLYETLAIVVGHRNPDEARKLDAVARRLRQAKDKPTRKNP